MKHVILPFFILVTMGAAHAQNATPVPPPITVTVTPSEQAGWDQIPTALQQCVGALVLQADATICKTVHTFLQAYSDKVKAAK